MKILVHHLQEGFPDPVRQVYDPKALDLEFVDLHYLSPVTMEGSVEKSEDTLTFRGQLKSVLQHTCARCLKPVDESLNHPFELLYEIAGRHEIDTLDDLREILILNHSERYLCREDCKGLCPQCGADLNEGICNCHLRRSR